MTQNDVAMIEASAASESVSESVNDSVESVNELVADESVTSDTPGEAMGETRLCVPWIVFASGQGLRGEYGTTASSGIDATLEEEVSVLCREFHNAIGVQEVPDTPPVVLFWKARQLSHRIVTQVLRAPQQPGQRIAYEYFSLILTEDDLHALGGKPLRVPELFDIGQLRAGYAAGSREPICAAITETIENSATNTARPSQFSQNGAWPATQDNHQALLSYLNSLNSDEGTERTFATWWPGAKAPRPGVFDLVLRSDATRVAKPHEVLAVATELKQSLSRSLLSPPSYDAVAARYYRALLHSADEVQTMLNEAYFPAALEESPHRWMTRPQKVAGMCQKIADDLPDYAARLPASFSDEMASQCSELAEQYENFARELQKLRHPNMLHQSREPKPVGAASTAKKQSVSDPDDIRKGMQIALLLGGLLILCLLGFGVRALIGKPNEKVNPALANSRVKMVAPSSGNQALRDRQAIALMRSRAEREVFRVARTLAARRTSPGKALSKDAMQSIIEDAVAQAMSQTPYSQIEPAQKRLLFRMSTAPIRAKAMEGVRAGIRQRGPAGSAGHTR